MPSAILQIAKHRTFATSYTNSTPHIKKSTFIRLQRSPIYYYRGTLPTYILPMWTATSAELFESIFLTFNIRRMLFASVRLHIP